MMLPAPRGGSWCGR